MEKEKLNLVEILKDAPSGIKLYSTIYGDCAFARIDNERGDYPILISVVNRCNDNYEESLTSDGRNYVDFNGECALFPSKENRSWEGWKYCSVKEGDFVMAGDNATDWCLSKYVEYDIVELRGVKTRVKYIVPAKDFDFENIESNIQKSIV